MKRKNLSIIVILTTVISVIIILYLNDMLPVLNKNITGLLEETIMDKGIIDKKANSETANSIISNKTKGSEIPKDNRIYNFAYEDIIKNRNTIDRAKSILLSTRISPIDYAKIENYLKEEDEIQGLHKTITLLKVRLSRKEYEIFRKDISEYIDIYKLETLQIKG
jgi:hypothetical protein